MLGKEDSGETQSEFIFEGQKNGDELLQLLPSAVSVPS
jgi:hypothetical protein